MRILAPDGFDYGNARLRAQRAGLLGRADYGVLLTLDPGAVCRAIEVTVGVPNDVAAKSPHPTLPALHQALARQVGSALERMRSFYVGVARELVDLMLWRFDTSNAVTVLRMAARGERGRPTPLLPVGWLGSDAGAEALRLRDPAAVIDLLIGSLTDRVQGRTLRRAFADFERTGDLAALEHAVVAGDAARVTGALSGAGPGAARLLQITRSEIDDHNLLVALRARAARAAAAESNMTTDNTFLPGGSRPARSFTAIMQAATRAAVVATTTPDPRWAVALRRWAVGPGDLPELEGALARAALAERIALFGTGDPLTIDIPLAFTAAVQAQARNLHLVGEAALRPLPIDVVERELLWPREQS